MPKSDVMLADAPETASDDKLARKTKSTSDKQPSVVKGKKEPKLGFKKDMPTDDEAYIMPEPPSHFTDDDVDQLLMYAEQFGFSDMYIKTDMGISIKVHGQLRPIITRKLNYSEVNTISSKLYGASNASAVVGQGRDIDCSYDLRVDRTKRYRYRVNVVGCLVRGAKGLQVTIRSIPTDPPKMDALGVEDEVRKHYAPVQGLVVVSGATGSGKSTLLASFIRNILEDHGASNVIVTYEAPIEFVYDNVDKGKSIITQSEVGLNFENFEQGIRNSLRRAPTVILVGEARDRETIEAAVLASMTGHLVYTTAHSRSVAETFRRMVMAFGAEERSSAMVDIIEASRLFIAQRLVIGTSGKRVALREYLVFDEEVRNQLLDIEPDRVAGATRQLVIDKGQSMYQDACEKHKQGLIDDMTLRTIRAGS